MYLGVKINGEGPKLNRKSNRNLTDWGVQAEIECIEPWLRISKNRIDWESNMTYINHRENLSGIQPQSTPEICQKICPKPCTLDICNGVRDFRWEREQSLAWGPGGLRPCLEFVARSTKNRRSGLRTDSRSQRFETPKKFLCKAWCFISLGKFSTKKPSEDTKPIVTPRWAEHWCHCTNTCNVNCWTSGHGHMQLYLAPWVGWCLHPLKDICTNGCANLWQTGCYDTYIQNIG